MYGVVIAPKGSERGRKIIITEPVLSGLTMDAVQAEALRAVSKHGIHVISGPEYTDCDRLAILMEEVGEVAHELTYDQARDKDKLVKELIQVATMAAMWAEYADSTP